MKKMVNKTVEMINKVSLELWVRGKECLSNNKGVGLVEVLMIAGGCIIVAFVFIPGLRTFSGNIITGMENWWTNTIQRLIFPTS